jgi:hypothetical protein
VNDKQRAEKPAERKKNATEVAEWENRAKIIGGVELAD